MHFKVKIVHDTNTTHFLNLLLLFILQPRVDVNPFIMKHANIPAIVSND